jgi:CheY-like chemotaxis protein
MMGPDHPPLAAALHKPHVILLDIGLPNMSGYEVARRLRSSPSTDKALLVAITGYGRDDDRRKSKEAGFDHHLTKPVDFTTLTDVLQPFVQHQ